MAEKFNERDTPSQHEPTQIYIDNMSATALVKNLVAHGRSKIIDTKYHFIRQQVKENNIKLVYCRTEDQVADIFMKPLKVETFEYFRTKLGLRSVSFLEQYRFIRH